MMTILMTQLEMGLSPLGDNGKYINFRDDDPNHHSSDIAKVGRSIYPMNSCDKYPPFVLLVKSPQPNMPDAIQYSEKQKHNLW